MCIILYGTQYNGFSIISHVDATPSLSFVAACNDWRAPARCSQVAASPWQRAPMRPKPLIPTRIAILCVLWLRGSEAEAEWRTGVRRRPSGHRPRRELLPPDAAERPRNFIEGQINFAPVSHRYWYDDRAGSPACLRSRRPSLTAAAADKKTSEQCQQDALQALLGPIPRRSRVRR